MYAMLGQTSTVNTVVIFNRTLGILGSGEFDLQNLFSHELAPIPTSLFLDDGRMRPASSKSKLSVFFHVEKSSRNKLQKPDLVVLWTIMQYFGPYNGQYLTRPRIWHI